MMNELNLSELLAEAKRHEVACILLSNGYADVHGKYHVLAGFGAENEWREPEKLSYSEECLMGFCGYDLKNVFEKLHSVHPSAVSVPDFYFFKPQLYYRHLRNGKIESNLISKAGEEVAAHKPLEVDFTCKTSVADYLKNVDLIKECIVRGDFYEMNYCLEFSADGDFDPYSIFYRLNTMAPAPFASFFKFNDRYLMCSSPERFLAKRQDKLVSQPIKGTRKRGAENDEGTVSELMNNEKDRAENVMITDLVRNDLSRVCEPGSVVVDELCKVYSFSHVHQMISSISGELRKNTSFSDILRATFPMGSMTGAPKIQVMKDTETFENFKRGWYSGCVGYLEKGDFDLNVVIRSLQMIKGAGCLHYHVGGAITIDSNAEEEYQECMHKAAGMIQALRG